jgi:hypothetical protein
LRHPSIRKGRLNTETRNKRYSIFSLGSSIPYLNSFVHQPRATVPVVIITPSTPTRNICPLSPSLSFPQLELVDDTTVEPHPPIIYEDIGQVPLTFENQISIPPPPPDIENDISEIEFDSWTISVPQSSLEPETPEPSFFLPESLQKITFEPICYTSHNISTVSDTLYDVPTWNDTAPVLSVGIPSYFTSTPPRRRRSAKTKLRDIENNHVEPIDHPNHTFYQYLDHTPYPDVFDLDMYSNASIIWREKFRKRDRTLFFESDAPLCSSPVSYLEHEPDLKPSHNNMKNNSSQTPSQLPSQYRIPPPHNPRKPLNDSTNTTSPNPTLYSIETSPAKCLNSPRKCHSVPVSSTFETIYSDSTPESDAGSMEALRARLREACESFSTPIFTEEKEIWEPVSF